MTGAKVYFTAFLVFSIVSIAGGVSLDDPIFSRLLPIPPEVQTIIRQELWLDQTGTEMIVNGTFDTDSSGWVLSGSSKYDSVNQNLLFESGGLSSQTFPTISGALYSWGFQIGFSGTSISQRMRVRFIDSITGIVLSEQSQNLRSASFISGSFVGTGNPVRVEFEDQTFLNLSSGWSLDNISVLESNVPPSTITPTETSTMTETPTETMTGTETPTPTETPTETPTPTPTETSTSTSTGTSTETVTETPSATDSPSPTGTDTPPPADTPSPTQTPTSLPTSTGTPTGTPTSLPTSTGTPTGTPTPSKSPAGTPTNPGTAIPSLTWTSTPIPTNTETNTPTGTSTETPTDTPILLPTLTDTPIPLPTPTPSPGAVLLGLTFCQEVPTSVDYLYVPPLQGINLLQLEPSLRSIVVTIYSGGSVSWKGEVLGDTPIPYQRDVQMIRITNFSCR